MNRLAHVVTLAGLSSLPLSAPVVSAQTPPTVKLLALEVNQGVQNLANGVLLVAGRDAIVRAYVGTTSGTQPITGRLIISQPGEPTEQIVVSDPVMASVLTEEGLAQVRADRTKTLNFVVPGSTLRGSEVTVKAELLVGDHAVACDGCEVTVTRSLARVPPLRVKLVGLRYRLQNRTYEPRAIDWSRIPLWLERAYPVPSVEYATVVIDAAFPWPFNCLQAMSQVRELRAAETGSGGTDPRTHYYAVVYGEEVQTFMRGCASVPDTPDASAVGAGPTGPVTNFTNFAWDTDGSFGDWYAGHEIGHTFGRAHPGLCGSGAPLDPAFVPDTAGHRRFDNTLLAQTASPRDTAGLDRRTADWEVLPGTVWNDMMDYCAKQWLSPYTYEAVAARLIAEDASPPGPDGQPSAGVAVSNVAAQGAGVTEPQAGVVNAAEPAQPPAPRAVQPKPIAEGQFLTVIARVNREKGTGVIDSMVPVRRTFSKSYGTPPDSSRGATLRVLYRGGETRLYGCDMHAVSQDPPEPGATAAAGGPQALTYDTTVECTFPQGGIPDRATVLVEGKPVAEHVSPKGNVKVKSAGPVAAGADGPGPSPLTYQWTSSGQSANTRYLVKISVDGGTNWKVLAVGLKATMVEIPPAEFKGVSQFLVEITAIDGMRIDTLTPKVVNVPRSPQP
jgi:hypothetical protein